MPTPTARRTRIPTLLTALTVAAALSGCGGAATVPQHPGASSASPQAGHPGGHNAADIAFATGMIPHHQQALTLSALVPARSTNPELITLAQHIEAAQQPEIQALQAFLAQWEAPRAAGHPDAHMAGMVDEATMERLASLRGDAFDTLWLRCMIEHHRGAVAMADTELADGANPDAKTLATDIIGAQQTEIDQMTTMLEG